MFIFLCDYTNMKVSDCRYSFLYIIFCRLGSNLCIFVPKTAVTTHAE